MSSRPGWPNAQLCCSPLVQKAESEIFYCSALWGQNLVNSGNSSSSFSFVYSGTLLAAGVSLVHSRFVSFYLLPLAMLGKQRLTTVLPALARAPHCLEAGSKNQVFSLWSQECQVSMKQVFVIQCPSEYSATANIFFILTCPPFFHVQSVWIWNKDCN